MNDFSLSPAASAKQELLFIDDEAGVRRSIVRALRSESYRIWTATSGSEGLEIFRARMHRLAMVISDYKMPGMDGLETLTTIGRLKPSITRIILTGYATVKAAIAATNEGIDGFLTKPFDNVELRAKLREISVRKHLREFVSDQVYQRIRRARGSIDPAFHQATVLFSDIRGFSQMSQQVAPGILAEFLNECYFGPMGEIAFQYGGAVDKHIGDSMMVVYGAPLSSGSEALRAVESAREMQREALKIDGQLQERRQPLHMKIGIGIATGRVFSGVLGSERKKEYTSIGTAVNMAARLQGLAGGGEVYMCEKTYRMVSDSVHAEKTGPVQIKGFEDPVTVFRFFQPPPKASRGNALAVGVRK